MTIITQIGEKFEKLADVLSDYDKELDNIEDILSLKNKTVEKANMENPTWQSYYDQKKIELGILNKYFEMEVARVRGKLFYRMKENNQVSLNEREINQYINNEEAYLDIYQISLEVREMYQKYTAVIEAFKTRGYALNNITKLRVASLEDAIL